MRRRLAIAGLLLLALPGTAMAASIDLRRDDSGRSFCLRRGDNVQIVLAENPSTGYAWRFTAFPNRTVLRLTYSRYVADPHPPMSVGGGGKHTYRLHMVRNGRTSLTLGLFRPGQLTGRPTDRFRLSVGC